MDWIRRNWPDLLIGIALVAVIAGIIATLLTGGSFFPLGASQASSSRPEQSSSTLDRGPSASIGNAEVATSARNDLSEASEDDASAEGQLPVSALPLPGSNDVADEVGTPPAGETDSAATPVADTPASAGGSVQLPAADEEGVYRISVGAFTAAENAERQAETFRQAGFPVFIGTQGDLSIVLVGPYDDVAEAEGTAARIRAGDFRIEPVIYRFRAGSETESPAGVSSNAAAAPTPQPTAAQATAGRYLQAGAYGNRSSAQPQRERLEGLGFRVTERVEGGYVKLLLGPFAGDEMTEARTLLSEQGIDHFPR